MLADHLSICLAPLVRHCVLLSLILLRITVQQFCNCTGHRAFRPLGQLARVRPPFPNGPLASSLPAAIPPIMPLDYRYIASN